MKIKSVLIILVILTALSVVETRAMVKSVIEPINKEQIKNNISYIIITDENLSDEFQRLADWKTKKGIPARVFNLTWIYERCPQRDNALYYSNHENENKVGYFMQTRNSIDLSNATYATLNYSVVYNIENGWDFAYVEVSAVDKKIWKQLNGTNMTAYRDPEAYVGINGVMAYTGCSGGWVSDTINLSGYIGDRILLRFRYLTDNYTGYDGFSVDDISVNTDKEIIFFDDAEEGDENWIMSGFTLLEDKPKAKAIRNFIKDMHMNHGTKWVLLGGDTDIVPFMGAYTSTKSATYVDNNIPTDLYYSDLNGTWNQDGDNNYGETIDGVDLYPDVFVGRVPASTPIEARNFVNKTLTYEKNPPTGYVHKILFLAEWVDNETDGAIAKDLIGEGIPSGFFITKLYESDGNLNSTNAIEEMNKGYGLINHEGHASPLKLSVGPNRLNCEHIDMLDNSSRYFILYSVGSNSNSMDEDSIAECFINSHNGAVAYIGNSRLGWYQPGNPGNGTSDRYDQEFFKYFFKNLTLGEVFALSKASLISHSTTDNSYRWVQYGLNLLGDPELPIWTSEPRNFTVFMPQWIIKNHELIINVKDNNLSLSDARVCLMQDIPIVRKTNISGEVKFVLNGSGNFSVTITKPNFLPYETSLWVYDCANDLDCSENESCKNQYCEEISCECGYISKHRCISYECCSNDDCKPNQICVNHTCVEQKLKITVITEHEYAVVNEILSIKIRDENENPVQDAKITITYEDGIQFNYTSDVNGQVEIIAEKAGVLNLDVEKTGYEGEKIEINVKEGRKSDVLVYSLILLTIVITIITGLALKRRYLE